MGFICYFSQLTTFFANINMPGGATKEGMLGLSSPVVRLWWWTSLWKLAIIYFVYGNYFTIKEDVLFFLHDFQGTKGADVKRFTNLKNKNTWTKKHQCKSYNTNPYSTTQRQIPQHKFKIQQTNWHKCQSPKQMQQHHNGRECQ